MDINDLLKMIGEMQVEIRLLRQALAQAKSSQVEQQKAAPEGAEQEAPEAE